MAVPPTTVMNSRHLTETSSTTKRCQNIRDPTEVLCSTLRQLLERLSPLSSPRSDHESGGERGYREDISMTRYSAPLLIAATMYFMTLPAPALAHGLPSVVATFILSFLAFALVAPTLTDYFAIKRGLFKDRARLAAILANLSAAAVAIPLFLALQWLSGAAAM